MAGARPLVTMVLVGRAGAVAQEHEGMTVTVVTATKEGA